MPGISDSCSKLPASGVSSSPDGDDPMLFSVRPTALSGEAGGEEDNTVKLFQNAFYAALLLAASACMAQTKGDVVAIIPFPFVVAGHTLPAGRYIVSPMNQSTLRLQESTGPGMLVSTNDALRPRSDDESSKLVFHRYESTYFLSQVWITGSERGRAVRRSNAELELAAKSKQRANNVIVAVR